MGSARPSGPGPSWSCPSPALRVHTLTLRASPGAGASVMLSTGGQKHPAGGNLTLPVGPQHLPCEPPPLARATVPGPGTHRYRVSASVARSACCSSRHVAGTKSSKAVFHGVGSDRSRLGPGDESVGAMGFCKVPTILSLIAPRAPSDSSSPLPSCLQDLDRMG